MRSLLLRLRADGKAILMITHDMDDAAELADHMIVLEGGSIVARGRPRGAFAGARATGFESTGSQKALDALGTPKPLAFARELARLGTPLPRYRSLLTSLSRRIGYGLAR